MTQQQLCELTVEYLEADPDEAQGRKEDLEVYLRKAGNNSEQINFWMGCSLELTPDEGASLSAVVASEVALAVMQGHVQAC